MLNQIDKEPMEMVQHKALVCSDFDHDCFGVDGNWCKKEQLRIINGCLIHLEAADGVCPMAR